MLFIILLIGFGVAIALPQVKKHYDIENARKAVAVARQIAEAEKAYYAKNGFYTADFLQLGLNLPCQETVKDGQTVLYCFKYHFALQDADTLRVGSAKYPKWFIVSLADGHITCNHEEGSLAGERICAQVAL